MNRYMLVAFLCLAVLPLNVQSAGSQKWHMKTLKDDFSETVSCFLRSPDIPYTKYGWPEKPEKKKFYLMYVPGYSFVLGPESGKDYISEFNSDRFVKINNSKLIRLNTKLNATGFDLKKELLKGSRVYIKHRVAGNNEWVNKLLIPSDGFSKAYNELQKCRKRADFKQKETWGYYDPTEKSEVQSFIDNL